MKIVVPHIHKIEGKAGFWAKVAKTGKIEDLRIEVLEGLRQIEGILIGRRVQDVPIVVSRICGICPVVHILNACSALEKALEIKVSPEIILLRKLFLVSQIIQSHTLHLFFMSLPDFFNLENELDLMKKFKKETRAALKIRDFSLKIARIVGGRAVHPIRPQLGGFTKLPTKPDLKKILRDFPFIIEQALILAETFKDLSYPVLKRRTNFVSLFSKDEYSFYQAPHLLSKNKKITISHFYANEIEEDLKILPVKRVKYRGEPYLVGAMARIKNNGQFLAPLARKFFQDFKKKHSLSEEDFFANVYYNIFSQAIEVIHFLEISEQVTKEILKSEFQESKKEFQISKGSGLSAMEAPRGTLFTYLEVDKQGRILNCHIVTPTAQFLANLEEDLKVLMPQIFKLSEKEKIRKVRSLIRAYDPCISCAVH